MKKTMMKALVQTRQADWDKTPKGDVSVMEMGTVPAPTAEDLKPGEVMVRIHAAALNPVDIKRTVFPLEGGPVPAVVGHDMAGVVEAVASDVSRWRPGDRVFGDLQANTAGPKLTGSVAEIATCRADLLARVPDAVSFAQAAALPLVGQTALQTLRLAGARRGCRVFVSAGAGGVGIHLMQIAKSFYGAAEVATTASAAKEDFVKRHGADVVVDYRTQDAAQVLRDWADAVVDCTHQLDMAHAILNSNNTNTSDGGGGGGVVTIVEPPVHGTTLHLITPCEDDMQAIAHLLSEGKLSPVIDSVYSLDSAMDAVHRQHSGRAMGKVVIKVIDD